MKLLSRIFTGPGITVVLLPISILAGCSNQGMYDSIRYSNQVECRKLPQPQYEECMQQNSMEYDDYRREREKVLNEKTESAG
ncbi:hypothetical protein BTA51_17410 [Hahella sp. CCB-MM4]|uniref:hypothetical protein n=1 Tax=Hahella sp. (strain CCB-MM4) TaxID=1926491 RepID=UPI000B9B453D|nr:hypothetical protein [Hahella sp. CCB-MM4]OZG72135.1 hypothetical protein BTA51_17410 [Hahella sp. CCB-MM4]